MPPPPPPPQTKTDMAPPPQPPAQKGGVDVAAYFKKPGKIHFTAGRRNLQDLMSDKQPSTTNKSTLPRMRKQKIGKQELEICHCL